jgi:hypothetical protein
MDNATFSYKVQQHLQTAGLKFPVTQRQTHLLISQPAFYKRGFGDRVMAVYQLYFHGGKSTTKILVKPVSFQF